MGIGRCILLTPPGGAAIAVVRIAGDGVGAFLRDRFDQPVREGRCVHGTLADGGRVVDDPVVVISGEGTVADLSIHGGPWVVRTVMDLMGRAACLVFPSIWYDGMPRTIVESYAKGTPVVASRLGSMTELIEPERTGFLFEAGSADDLAARVRQLAADGPLRQSMRARARELFLDRYTADENHRQLLAIYERAIRVAPRA